LIYRLFPGRAPLGNGLTGIPAAVALWIDFSKVQVENSRARDSSVALAGPGLQFCVEFHASRSGHDNYELLSATAYPAKLSIRPLA
jgi:hypothetical protein